MSIDDGLKFQGRYKVRVQHPMLRTFNRRLIADSADGFIAVLPDQLGTELDDEVLITIEIKRIKRGKPVRT